MRIKKHILKIANHLGDVYYKLFSPWGDSQKIFQNTISINIAFLSIVLAFYIAVSTYFTPQLKQLEIERDLEFNRMLVSIDKLIYGGTSAAKNQQYYLNDTLNIEKIELSLMSMSSWASKIYDNRNHYPIEEVVLAAHRYIDTLRLISLISNQPILHLPVEKDSTVKQIIRGQNYIPYSDKLFLDIDRFLRITRLHEQVYFGKDVRLIEYCADFPFFVGTDSTGKKSYTWVHRELDSLNSAFKQNPNYLTQTHIRHFEESIQRNKYQLSGYSNFYQNIKSIYDTYIIKISELNFKVALYKDILLSLKQFNGIIILIFIINIIFPSILFNVNCNGKFALIYFLAGIIPYWILIKKILNFI